MCPVKDTSLRILIMILRKITYQDGPSGVQNNGHLKASIVKKCDNFSTGHNIKQKQFHKSDTLAIYG